MNKLNRSFQYIFIIVMAIITIFPFLYMISASLMSFQEATSIPPTLFPKEIQISNYKEAFDEAPFARYFLNTIIVAVIETSVTLITTILAGFALSFLDFKGKKIVQTSFILLLMIPSQVTIFTNYKTIAESGLLDTYMALVLPFLASVFYIFYLNQYLTSIPKSYYNAAKVQGCGDLEFIYRIMIPMSKKSLLTIALLNFIAARNSFLRPILVTNSEEMRLISNGLSAFSSEAGAKVQLQMAASTITIVPILILYFIFRKQIIGGVTRSGLKG